ncbi:lectin subunit alpha [Stomoxys calcitrans]|uniref:lectin subunit alpha n=1 Tax=Stomoxys calcitrans TaxID=35570 RepID=UPI0027E256D8|nr:lectin subunit alpha [Stomoxys calcitrans]
MRFRKYCSAWKATKMNTSMRQLLQSFLLIAIIWHNAVAVPEWHTASDGKEYLIEKELKYNWLQAYDECARRDLNLVVIEGEEKNVAFTALLREKFAKPSPLWLGYHDEFNLAKGPRHFFSISTGQPLTFTNWFKGEPKNIKKKEHCAYVGGNSEYKWADASCDNSKYGYICEKDESSTNCQDDMKDIRKEVKALNEAVSAEFANHRRDVTDILENNNNENNQIVEDLVAAKKAIIVESQKSIDAVLLRKPYLQAVLADVGDEFLAILNNALDGMSTVSTEAWQSIQVNHVRTVAEVNSASDNFAQDLESNTVDVDNLFD